MTPFLQRLIQETSNSYNDNHFFLCLLFPRYESSGYDDGSFRKAYTSSPFNSSRPLFQQQVQQQQVQQQQQQHSETTQKSTIESGPSFHESMERFKSATGSGSGTESDGGRASSSVKQKYSASTSSSSVTQSAMSIHRTAVTRSVEEQRTMITRNSQKSYHIE